MIPTVNNKFVKLAILFFFIATNLNAQMGAEMRRPISPNQPMWLVHIDTHNKPDPQAIIDLIPKDIRPFVVMNISLSGSTEKNVFNRFLQEYGVEIAKSWLRTCAENGMWAMIQPSSGPWSHLPDNDMTIYTELYKDYPNLIGFNYCEQSYGWSFATTHPGLAYNWESRMAHFEKLLKLSDEYGGYLSVSWCANIHNPNENPIGMLKRNPTFVTASQQYADHYILSEKYTFKTFQSDLESVSLGAYLSGYSGQYGIRYDNSGWTDASGEIGANFTLATGGAPILEHIMLTGQTVIDGPELIDRQCFHETKEPVSTTDGYTVRNWETFPQFDNVSVDNFRKILDGTVRIPSRQEVIDRTKVVIINDVNSGSKPDKYSSPETLFEGLYRMDSDGNYGENRSFFKKTGRYPTIPTVYDLHGTVANSFPVQIKKSDYSKRWPDISSKVTELNKLFPEEYTGDLYAGRHENGWVTYNPYKTDQVASASIPFKYNTSERMELSYSQYTAGVVKEYADKITLYLSNFDQQLNPNLKPNIIKIYGSTLEPTYSVEDRAANIVSKVTKDWTDGVFTLTLEHNGPVDISINCSGNATNRLTKYQTANIVVPNSPPTYKGPYQYEGETFEYSNIVKIEKNGYSENFRNYTGQGYLEFGTKSSAKIRDYVTVLNDGNYLLKTKYMAPGAAINTIDLYVNGSLVSTPSFSKTNSLEEWSVDSRMITLNKGVNTIEFRAKATGSGAIFFDNIVIESNDTSDIWLEAECGSVGSLWNTTQDSKASNSDYVTIKPGNNSTSSVPSNTNGHLTYDFNVTENGAYKLWARVLADSSINDSFWMKMDNGSWSNWNNIGPHTNWGWEKFKEFTLTSGKHTLTVAYSEDGVQLDKIFLTLSNTTPSGKGGAGTNCVTNNQKPLAYAGSDKTIITDIGSGLEAVSLDGGGSLDANGSIVSYIWESNGTQVGVGKEPTINLPSGVHLIKLIVTDNEGAVDTDNVTITIYDENTYNSGTLWLEVECETIGSNWDTINNQTVSGSKYVVSKPGVSNSQVPTSNDDLVQMSFTIKTTGTYAVYGRMNCPGASSDSFWVRMDRGSFNSNNGLRTNGWEWKSLGTFALSLGTHIMDIGYRENGGQLDKFLFTKLTNKPLGIGNDTVNCNEDVAEDPDTPDNTGNDAVEVKLFPNPAKETITIDMGLELASNLGLTVYDITGRVILKKEITSSIYNLDIQFLETGTYFMQLQSNEISITKTFIKAN